MRRVLLALVIAFDTILDVLDRGLDYLDGLLDDAEMRRRRRS